MPKTVKTNFEDFSIERCVCYSTKTGFQFRWRVLHVQSISKWISIYYHIWKDYQFDSRLVLQFQPPTAMSNI